MKIKYHSIFNKLSANTIDWSEIRTGEKLSEEMMKQEN